MERKIFPKSASVKQKHKLISQRLHKKKPGKVTLQYHEKTRLTQDINFMKRGGTIKVPLAVIAPKPATIRQLESMWKLPEPAMWWSKLPDIITAWHYKVVDISFK